MKWTNNSRNNTHKELTHLIFLIDNVTIWIQLISIILSFIGNFLIIFGTCQVHQLTINKLVINYLALCDMAYSFVQIFYVHRKLSSHSWGFGSVMCSLTRLSSCAIITSLFIITFIAFERHRSILYPLQTKFGKWKINVFIVMVIVLSFILNFPYMIHMKVEQIGIQRDCRCTWNTELKRYWDVLVFSLTYPLPIMVFLYCYVRIIARVTHRFELTTVSLRGNINIRHKKLCVTLATIVIVFVLTTSPNQILILWHGFADTASTDAEKTFVILYALSSLVHLHSFANPLIYSFSDAKFRKILCHIVDDRQQLRKTITVSLRGLKKPDAECKINKRLLDEEHHQESIDLVTQPQIHQQVIPTIEYTTVC